jgi:8-oxo-dGTP pyrophosphatase MutT (NUDIX family)
MQESVFIPRPGQIDYTHATRVPVVDCVVEHEGKLLIMKRSSAMNHYPGVWHCIAGYLDDHKGPIDKAKEELAEEAGIEPDRVVEARVADPFEVVDSRLGKTWVVHPVFVRIATSEVALNWESEDYRWIDPSELSDYELLDGFEGALRAFSKL